MNQDRPRTAPKAELDDSRIETVHGDSHDPGENDENELIAEELADEDSGDALRPQ